MARETYVLKKLPSGEHVLVPRDEVSAWTARHYPDKRSGVIAMPKKVKRGSWVWRDGKLIDRVAAERKRGLQIIKDIEPYQNVGVDYGVVGGRRQHRDMLKAHGLVEVGNEKPRQHPRDILAKRRERPMQEIVDSLKKASQGAWL